VSGGIHKFGEQEYTDGWSKVEKGEGKQGVRRKQKAEGGKQKADWSNDI
jgi:hypothetical protein